MAAKQRSSIPAVLAGVGMAVVWGFSFLFTKETLDYTVPLQLLGFRFAAAAVFLTILKGIGLIKINLKGKKWSSLILLGFVQPGLYFIGETWGVKWTTASEAGMIIALVPVAAASMAALFLKEKLYPFQVFSIVLSVTGVGFIVAGQGDVQIGEHLFGVLALFVAVLAAGIYSILSKRSSALFTPLEITYVMMWTGTFIFNSLGLGQSLIAGRLMDYLAPWSIPSVIWGIVYLGLLSSVIAFLMFNFILSKLSVSQSAAFTNLTTVVSVFAGVFFRGETFTWIQAAGVTLIIIGVWGTIVRTAKPIETLTKPSGEV